VVQDSEFGSSRVFFVMWVCAIMLSYESCPNGSYDRIFLNSTRVKFLNDDVDLKFVLEVPSLHLNDIFQIQ
jgi:hypothetical protein